ncbi:NAD(P)H-hydrate dehydratase [Echinimonas agarilytica]|uniref:Bifunctional NAD(P)H-hydrate repair enzyme n=1 Tax=Echinimonas agarilytica TaxID=1215918 RepID=A0AA42B688_9GAMM|nr:NAD(P)H-hydrate dehydratase [Echinimonas agarilytica]MCM2678460.1 NAD(P)H-hydrate dehydratase [Echinimonas agarilytica]
MTGYELSPTSLPYKLYTGDQVRKYEPVAAQIAGATLAALMERAGEACFNAIRRRWQNKQRLLILCGRGNNGGDGYVVARLAKQHSFGVQLVQVGDPNALSGEVAQARDKWLQIGGQILPFDEANIEQADIVVDALLGTGLNRPVEPPFDYMIQVINQLNKPVCAVDIPSGVCANTGRVLGDAVVADLSVSFVARKRGMYTGRAADFVGDIEFDELGIRQAFQDQVESNVEQVRYANFKHFLRPRNRTYHKGMCGKVYVVGGDLGMPGAIRLAAEACQRAGASIVTVVSRPEHIGPILSHRPELIVSGAQTAGAILRQQLAAAAKVIVVGPGMGTENWGQSMLQMCLETDVPLVVDADGLNILAATPSKRDNWILTPHPGEAARLLDTSVEAIEDDRFAAATQLQAKYGGVVILKGAGTVVTDGNMIRICRVGNPGMASGGMGDILSGIIGSLLAQGIPAFEAACLAVCIHGDAADLAAEVGERGMLASDLYPHVRRLVNPSSD